LSWSHLLPYVEQERKRSHCSEALALLERPQVGQGQIGPAREEERRDRDLRRQMATSRRRSGKKPGFEEDSTD